MHTSLQNVQSSRENENTHKKQMAVTKDPHVVPRKGRTHVVHWHPLPVVLLHVPVRRWPAGQLALSHALQLKPLVVPEQAPARHWWGFVQVALSQGWQTPGLLPDRHLLAPQSTLGVTLAWHSTSASLRCVTLTLDIVSTPPLLVYKVHPCSTWPGAAAPAPARGSAFPWTVHCPGRPPACK